MPQPTGQLLSAALEALALASTCSPGNVETHIKIPYYQCKTTRFAADLQILVNDFFSGFRKMNRKMPYRNPWRIWSCPANIFPWNTIYILWTFRPQHVLATSAPYLTYKKSMNASKIGVSLVCSGRGLEQFDWVSPPQTRTSKRPQQTKTAVFHLEVRYNQVQKMDFDQIQVHKLPRPVNGSGRGGGKMPVDGAQVEIFGQASFVSRPGRSLVQFPSSTSLWGGLNSHQAFNVCKKCHMYPFGELTHLQATTQKGNCAFALYTMRIYIYYTMYTCKHIDTYNKYTCVYSVFGSLGGDSWLEID